VYHTTVHRRARKTGLKYCTVAFFPTTTGKNKIIAKKALPGTKNLPTLRKRLQTLLTVNKIYSTNR
jgi:hypothetical protein